MTPMPIVDYLRLNGEPRLVANECAACGARFFDRRNACAACFGTEFHLVEIEPTGAVVSFSIVSFAGPDVEVPFVAAVVDCHGTSVRSNIVNTAADPEHVWLGMPVRLATYSMGVDSHAVEVIGFGFEPR